MAGADPLVADHADAPGRCALKRWLVALALAAVVESVLTLAVGAGAVLYARGARGVCVTEDSVSCVWFGPWQGNGRGRIVVNGPEGR